MLGIGLSFQDAQHGIRQVLFRERRGLELIEHAVWDGDVDLAVLPIERQLRPEDALGISGGKERFARQREPVERWFLFLFQDCTFAVGT